MKKILKGAAVLAAVSALAIGATMAFFSDVEVSEGNVFVAGALDLKISNESYYYGPNEQGMIDLWFMEDLSWMADDLVGHLFFDYEDLKPGDWGEDTIDIYIDDNPGWVCMDITLTGSYDNGMTEPEANVDLNPDLGELEEQIWFTFWADDGDNLFEVDENVLFDGWLYQLDGWSLTLADSMYNAWGLEPGTPVPGGEEVYIAKAWCYGDMLGWSPLPVDNPYASVNEAWTAYMMGDNPYGTGVYCDGSGDMMGLDHNLSQTDVVTLDVEFYAEQWRHNEEFTCGEPVPGFAEVSASRVF